MLVFFAKFAKGDYTTINGVTPLSRKFPHVQFVGISLDPSKADAESFLKKMGTAMPEIYIDNLDVPFPLAWDEDKEVAGAYKKTAKMLSLNASACFIVDSEGIIVWREQFGQGHPPSKGQLGKQLENLVKKQPLISNGPNPAAAEEGEEEEEMDMGDYDSDLGF